MNRKRLLLLLSLTLVGGILPTTASTLLAHAEEVTEEAPINTEITFSGSSTLAPVISQLAADFISEYESWDQVAEDLPEKSIQLYVSSGGSGAGVKAVLDGIADFGMLARDIKEEEKDAFHDMNEVVVGIDALTVAVHPDNPILELMDGNISKEDVAKIFSGEYETWKQVDEELPDEEIVVVTRDLSGGAHQVFQDTIMGETEVTANAIQEPSMGALVSKIIENPNAIGYASFGMVNQNEGQLIPMRIDDIEPTVENIVSGEYKVSRPLILVKDGPFTETEQLFLDYIMSEKGQKTIEDMGYIGVVEE